MWGQNQAEQAATMRNLTNPELMALLAAVTAEMDRRQALIARVTNHQIASTNAEVVPVGTTCLPLDSK